MFKKLEEVTGQETGIVKYDLGESFICNWTRVHGLPRLNLQGVLGMHESLFVRESWNVDDLSEEIDQRLIIYDANGDAARLGGLAARAYAVATKENGGAVCTVYAPQGWQ